MTELEEILINKNFCYTGIIFDIDGYLRIYIGNGKYKPIHRLIYELYYNCSLLSYVDLDHINCNKLDNRITNLRPYYKGQHASKHHPYLNMSERYCLLCDSKKTYVTKKGFVKWRRYEAGFICMKCAVLKDYYKKKS